MITRAEARRKIYRNNLPDLSFLKRVFALILDHPPWSQENDFGDSTQEFIKLDKSGGRRVYASQLFNLNYYLPYKAKKPHVQLETFFDRLCATGEFELRYALKAKIKELEVLDYGS